MPRRRATAHDNYEDGAVRADRIGTLLHLEQIWATKVKPIALPPWLFNNGYAAYGGLSCCAYWQHWPLLHSQSRAAGAHHTRSQPFKRGRGKIRSFVTVKPRSYREQKTQSY